MSHTSVEPTSEASAPADEIEKPINAPGLGCITDELQKTENHSEQARMQSIGGLVADPYTLARTLAAYALNTAYGATLAPFELEHLTALAKAVGCTVTPHQLTTLSIRVVLDELLKERLNQIKLGYTADYDDANPLHGRMEALHRLNDPNHTYAQIVEAAAILVADLERRKRHPATPAEVPCSIAPPRADGHVLYQQGDSDLPKYICDQNGDVVLAQCRVCGAVEIELDVACTGQPLVRE